MNNKSDNESTVTPIGADFFERLQQDSWTYIKTVVDVVREPVLVLDKNLCVMAANEPFYTTFQVERADTENKVVYELGNGQWNIPSLRKLLEEILPTNSFFKGFEVVHEFPWIGRKIMLLNARQIYFKSDSTFPPIILLAIEDMSQIMAVADKLSNHMSLLEANLTGRTKKVEGLIAKLAEDIQQLKAR